MLTVGVNSFQSAPYRWAFDPRVRESLNDLKLWVILLWTWENMECMFTEDCRSKAVLCCCGESDQLSSSNELHLWILSQVAIWMEGRHVRRKKKNNLKYIADNTCNVYEQWLSVSVKCLRTWFSGLFWMSSWWES